MQNDTFKTKLAKLVYKIKKAIRLYTTVSRGKSNSDKPYAELQIAQWRETNEKLLNRLQEIIQNNHLRKVSTDLHALKVSYSKESESLDQEIRLLHSELIAAARNADFVSSAKASTRLIPLKARQQACQAVIEELSDLLSDIVISSTIPADRDEEEHSSDRLKVRSAKILPFKRGVA